MKLENALKQTGGCGRYQILLTLIIHSMKCIVCFTMVFMVFGAAKSDWWCIEGLNEDNVTFTTDLPQYLSCTLFNSTQPCTKFYFDESKITTVISEWSLVCDREWITSTITSIQMSGVLVGNLVCGQVADVIGRKPPLFISIATLVVFNILAAFSTSWIMFAVIRFFLGVGMAFELTVQYSFLSEFTLPRWRTWIIAIPSWAIQTVLLSFVAWILKSWKYIHFATAAIGFPLLFTYWFVPESFRWYVSHNRLNDAESVMKKLAKVNKSAKIELNELKTMAKDIGKEMIPDRKYSCIDIIRNGSLFLYTSLLVIVWFAIGLGNYGIQFGVPALSGNLYINVFVIGLIMSPLQFIVIFMTNRFGRKISAISCYIIAGGSALVVAVAYRFEETEVIDTVTNIAAIISLIGINVAWSPLQTITLETYPTVVRNIGYGFQNTMARVGAIVGPQLVYLNTKFAGTLYWICGITFFLSILILLPLPETRDSNLPDKINESESEGTEESNSNIEIGDDKTSHNSV
ncbi:hypothetical protein ACF0H5_000101 [Mactra antiquata]